MSDTKWIQCSLCGSPAEAGFSRDYCSKQDCKHYDADTALKLKRPVRVYDNDMDYEDTKPYVHSISYPYRCGTPGHLHHKCTGDCHDPAARDLDLSKLPSSCLLRSAGLYKAYLQVEVMECFGGTLVRVEDRAGGEHLRRVPEKYITGTTYELADGSLYKRYKVLCIANLAKSCVFLPARLSGSYSGRIAVCRENLFVLGPICAEKVS